MPTFRASDITYYPCPACGYYVFDERPGSHSSCRICWWEDDLSQLRFPTTTGANRVTLIQAQKNFEKWGIKEKRYIVEAIPPEASDVRDAEWRPLTKDDNIEMPVSNKEYSGTYPSDITALYYWRSNYWRRGKPVEPVTS